MPNEISHFINWTGPFLFYGLLGGIFHFYSNLNRTFCKQTVETLSRSHKENARHIWFRTSVMLLKATVVKGQDIFYLFLPYSLYPNFDKMLKPPLKRDEDKCHPHPQLIDWCLCGM